MKLDYKKEKMDIQNNTNKKETTANLSEINK
jgi:hypothetical protein